MIKMQLMNMLFLKLHLGKWVRVHSNIAQERTLHLWSQCPPQIVKEWVGVELERTKLFR